MSVWLGVAPARGEPSLADWEPTGLAEPTLALFTPASGAFFARTESGLARSDDGGASWRPVPLPPGVSIGPGVLPRVVVDPNDHTRIFVGAWVTRDDAATWSALDPWAGDPAATVLPLPSAADPNLLYLAVRNGNQIRMLRSRGGGGAWDTVLELGPADFRPSSGVRVTLFEAHPSDSSVLFQSVVGFRGRDNQGILRRSADQGGRFQEVLASTRRFPARLVGGRGDAPGRFYAAMISEESSSALFKSDDGGVTWAEVATFGSSDATVYIRTMAYDPAAPGRVWVGLDKGGIKASEDGGQTWTDVSPADWDVWDVALGIDGANLYAATSEGVFKLPLS